MAAYVILMLVETPTMLLERLVLGPKPSKQEGNNIPVDASDEEMNLKRGNSSLKSNVHRKEDLSVITNGVHNLPMKHSLGNGTIISGGGQEILFDAVNKNLDFDNRAFQHVEKL